MNESDKVHRKADSRVRGIEQFLKITKPMQQQTLLNKNQNLLNENGENNLTHMEIHKKYISFEKV